MFMITHLAGGTARLKPRFLTPNPVLFLLYHSRQSSSDPFSFSFLICKTRGAGFRLDDLRF